nr:site-specific integrase [Solimonas sp. SE-A11]
MVFKDPLLEQRVRAFWILAFRFGLRRAEILGLQVRDVDGFWLRVRVNSVRALKTSNAYRLIPLHTLPKAELDAVLLLGADRVALDFLFFDERVPKRKDLDGHPVISRINDLLERLTGDSRLHPHNLRHTTATLLPLGTLGPDLGLMGHPYAEEWMLEAVSFAQDVDKAISGQLHRRAARGAALGMMMGHGDESTTYEHYVHSLDLLLFFSCCSGRFDPIKIPPDQHRYPQRKEMTQLLAMLGYHPTSRVDSRDHAALLRGIAERRPDRVTVLDHSGSKGMPPSPEEESITLQDLLALEVAKSWRGWPEGQAQRDTVNALLPLINAACLKDADRLKKSFGYWVKAQLENDDWASMDGDKALAFYAIAPDIPVEALWVRSVGRGTVKTVLKDAPELISACGDGAGKIWVRLRDLRPKRQPRRKKKSAVSRSKTQSTVSWVVHAVLHTCTDRGTKRDGDSDHPTSAACGS